MPGITLTYAGSAQVDLNGIMSALGLDTPEARVAFQGTFNNVLETYLNTGFNENPPRVYGEMLVDVKYRVNPHNEKAQENSRWLNATLIPPTPGGFKYKLTAIGYATASAETGDQQ